MRVFELEAMHQMFAVSRPGYAASFGLDRVVGRVGQSPRTSMQARWRSPLRTWSSTPSKVTASGTSSLQPTTGPQSTPVTKPESQPSGPQLVVCSPESGRGTGPLRPRRKPWALGQEVWLPNLIAGSVYLVTTQTVRAGVRG